MHFTLRTSQSIEENKQIPPPSVFQILDTKAIIAYYVGTPLLDIV